MWLKRHGIGLSRSPSEFGAVIALPGCYPHENQRRKLWSRASHRAKTVSFGAEFNLVAVIEAIPIFRKAIGKGFQGQRLLRRKYEAQDCTFCDVSFCGSLPDIFPGGAGAKRIRCHSRDGY
jgi:hypothetical protein